MQSAGDHVCLWAVIIGKKMRSGGKGESDQALQRAGRYTTITDSLSAKGVILKQGGVAAERFITVHSQQQADCDQMKRDDIIAKAELRITELGDLEGKDHTKRVCGLKAGSAFGKCLREQKNGSLKLATGKVAAKAKLDGKYFIRTTDSRLSVRDAVLGYKQLSEIERVNRDLMRVISFLAINGGELAQLNTVTSEQKRVLDALNLKPPNRNVSVERNFCVGPAAEAMTQTLEFLHGLGVAEDLAVLHDPKATSLESGWSPPNKSMLARRVLTIRKAPPRYRPTPLGQRWPSSPAMLRSSASIESGSRPNVLGMPRI